VKSQPEMSGANLSARVSTPTSYTVEDHNIETVATVAVIDLGVKRSTLEFLSQQGFRVQVLPESSTFEDIQASKANAVFYSNGPGDPSASERHITLLRKILDEGIPFFGICFGNQLLGRALGLETYK